ncbi:hypothetical protein CKK33_14830 [Mucilaginibacter sp. MD40]|nr:hypothetical protein CKK33_14830 [Mucilaginibacter sp. MD40]
MYFVFGLRSSLLLAFFIHLVVYAVLFLKRSVQRGRLSERLIGIFFLLAALFIAPWMLGFGGWYDTQPYRDILFYVPFLQPLFFGPLLYFYVKTLTNVNYRLTKTDLLHFIPGSVYLLWTIAVFVVDKLLLKRYYMMNGRTDPDFDPWFSWIWLGSVLVYLILTIKHYRKYKLYSRAEFSFADIVSFHWLRNFLYAFTTLSALFLFEHILSLIVELHYGQAWYYFLAFAIICYYMAISAYGNNFVPESKLNFQPENLEAYQEAMTTEIPLPSADHSWMIPWKQKLEQAMADRIFLSEDLTLSDLAQQLETNASLLSKVINSSYGQSFNDFINSARVNEAIRLMKDPYYQNYSLHAIALEAGFYSKATFNRAFKKFTGTNPSEYF